MHTVEEIAALLHIHKEAAAHGGAMNNIAGAALNRLRQINAEMAPDHFVEPREEGALPAAEPIPEGEEAHGEGEAEPEEDE